MNSIFSLNCLFKKTNFCCIMKRYHHLVCLVFVTVSIILRPSTSLKLYWFLYFFVMWSHLYMITTLGKYTFSLIWVSVSFIWLGYFFSYALFLVWLCSSFLDTMKTFRSHTSLCFQCWIKIEFSTGLILF